jgi:hypothetical protein
MFRQRQEHVDHQQHDDFVVADAQNDAGHLFRHPFDGHDVAEQRRQGDEEDDGGRRSACSITLL